MASNFERLKSLDISEAPEYFNTIVYDMLDELLNYCLFKEDMQPYILPEERRLRRLEFLSKWLREEEKSEDINNDNR